MSVDSDSELWGEFAQLGQIMWLSRAVSAFQQLLQKDLSRSSYSVPCTLRVCQPFAWHKRLGGTELTHCGLSPLRLPGPSGRRSLRSVTQAELFPKPARGSPSTGLPAV